MEEQRDGLYKVHVKLLDTDCQGREPTNDDFDFKWHTSFQEIATREKKVSISPI